MLNFVVELGSHPDCQNVSFTQVISAASIEYKYHQLLHTTLGLLHDP